MWDKLKKAEKPIVLYGMGNGADKILDIMDSLGISVSGVFASDGFVRHQNFRGFTVKSYDELRSEFGEMIVLVAFGTQRSEVLEQIRRISEEQELYVPDVPVIGSGLITVDYVKQAEDKLKFIYTKLSDERSKMTFENLLKYRLSGRPAYLFNCESSPQEAFKNVLQLTNKESFLDLGAYTGDTVMQFVKDVGGSYRSVTAVEPDIKNYNKLLKNTEALQNCRCINAAVGEHSGSTTFAMSAGRQSVISGNGTEITLQSVDDIVGDEEVTYIKMDVEGQEIDAIKGAVRTIGSQKPKLLISAYHRTDDYITIPFEVFKIRADYKMYIRHYPYLPAWDTNFYFV